MADEVKLPATITGLVFEETVAFPIKAFDAIFEQHSFRKRGRFYNVPLGDMPEVIAGCYSAEVKLILG